MTTLVGRCGPAAMLWSLLYGAAGVAWSLGAPGFPFGVAHDPEGARVSLLSGVTQSTAAPVIAVLGFAGAVLAWLMLRTRLAAAAWPAWVLAVGLAVLVPDYRALMRVAYAPILVILLPFGWPEGASAARFFQWPVMHQYLLILGGLLWAGAALAHRRRTGGRPVDWRRWGTRATVVAIAVPCLYAATRWAWALGIPLGVSRDFLVEADREAPGIWWAGASLATLAIGGAVLTLGLIRPWGEVFPRWIPFLRGRVVPPLVAVVPAVLVAVLVTSAGLMFVRAFTFGTIPGRRTDNLTTVGPELFWPLWGAALFVAALAYHQRRNLSDPAAELSIAPARGRPDRSCR